MPDHTLNGWRLVQRVLPDGSEATSYVRDEQDGPALRDYAERWNGLAGRLKQKGGE